MYSYISGTLNHVGEGLAVVDNNGIGYNIFVSNNTFSKLPKIGGEVKIFTHTYVKEDAFLLYGFLSNDEKNMFLKLINISGVGCKVAMQILSGLDATALAVAIVNSDIATLNQIKGIGKKTAERIILELKEKVNISDILKVENVQNLKVDDNTQDAILALVSLGVGKTEAYKAVIKAREVTDKTEQLITIALRNMGR